VTNGHRRQRPGRGSATPPKSASAGLRSRGALGRRLPEAPRPVWKPPVTSWRVPPDMDRSLLTSCSPAYASGRLADTRNGEIPIRGGIGRFAIPCERLSVNRDSRGSGASEGLGSAKSWRLGVINVLPTWPHQGAYHVWVAEPLQDVRDRLIRVVGGQTQTGGEVVDGTVGRDAPETAWTTINYWIRHVRPKPSHSGTPGGQTSTGSSTRPGLPALSPSTTSPPVCV